MKTSFLNFLPFIIIFFLIVFLSIPHNFLNFGVYTPEYIIILIFYFLLFDPKTLPYYLLIILGLEYDLIMKYPLGLNILLFLVINYSLNLQRKYLTSKNFLTIWLFFALNFIVIMILKILFLEISYDLSIIGNYHSFIFKTYFTILLYPIIQYLLDYIRYKIK
jgi:rod shape-determining protein MreD